MRITIKVLLALGILGCAAALLMTSGVGGADPYLDVRALVDDPEGYSDRTVSVKGTVAANSTVAEGNTVRFVVFDASGDLDHADKNLTVTYSGVLPDAFGPKMVVVTGTLVETATGLRFDAEDIQVGCSSKY